MSWLTAGFEEEENDREASMQTEMIREIALIASVSHEENKYLVTQFKHHSNQRGEQYD